MGEQGLTTRPDLGRHRGPRRAPVREVAPFHGATGRPRSRGLGRDDALSARDHLVQRRLGDQSLPSTSAPATVRLPAADEQPVAIESLGVDPATEQRCDPIGGAQCLLPFPNDHFTRTDRTTPTGRRLALDVTSTPSNTAGDHIDVTDQNRADGWSPGSTLIAQIPSLDVTRSKLPPITDVDTSLAPDSPIVLWDATARRRVPFWAEADSQADEGTVPLLLMHPARNFADGHRIVVGMRGLLDDRGTPIDPSPAFAAYRDGRRSTDPTFEARRPAMDRIFSSLGEAGMRRASLQLAWDFTVASTESITGRMIAMRDTAFDALGDDAPAFTVDSITEDPDPLVARRVEGSFTVPNFLDDDGGVGSRLVLDDEGVPVRQAHDFTARFLCDIPPKALAEPARAALYGHGLLGSMDEVKGDLTKQMGDRFNIVYCATNWYGMAEADVPSAAKALNDLSAFGALPDRLQEAMLSFLYLGRLLVHPGGFAANPAFRHDGRSVLKAKSLYYDGNSQGAILGGALTAVAQDFTRAALGEAGMNYGILLDRSVDFDEYLAVMRNSYPARVDRVIGLALVQLLWDRAETNGYANHVTTDPLPNTPRHTVLLYGAVGDHQVSEFSLRVEAMTMGAAAHRPIAGGGRSPLGDIGSKLPTLTGDNATGSVYFLWDTGSPPSPLTNTPPRKGHDPHDDTPSIPAAQHVKDQFLRPDGTVRSPCKGPCTAPVPPENAD
ncbi:MAG: hypothetical protein R2698_10795 [Microthrixaceae bacterium]